MAAVFRPEIEKKLLAFNVDNDAPMDCYIFPELDILKNLSTKLALTPTQNSQLMAYADGDIALTKRVEIMSPDVYVRHSPTETTIKVFSLHYKKKYGLDISFVSSEEAMALLKSKKELGAEGESFAMILKEPDSSHVIPVYCHFSKEDGQLYVLVMDSIDQISFPSQFALALAKSKPENIVAMFNTGPRQVSNRGCRIDALSTLKYTHYILKHERVMHIPDFIPELVKVNMEEWNEDRGEDTYFPCTAFNVPSCFVPAAQDMSFVATKGYESLVVNHKGETMEQLRKRHMKEYRIETTLRSDDKALTITTADIRSLRSYMILKEQKMVAQFEKVFRACSPSPFSSGAEEKK